MTVTLTVHQAATEIGGNLIELSIESGERLILDVGAPLDAPDDPPSSLIPSTLDLSGPVLGVLISHAHRDHWGLLAGLPANWPVWSGVATERLIRLTAAIPGEQVRHSFYHWKAGECFSIGPFSITPFLTDHSAFDAYMLLIEVNGKRILYSGDFRTHGRKGRLVKTLISDPPLPIDALVMEGTNLGTDKPVISEVELEQKFTDLFRSGEGRVFVTWSAQNVDRTVTLYRACKRAGRTLAVDLYTADVMETLADLAQLPRPGWPNVAVIITGRLRRHYARRGRQDFVQRMAETCGISARAVAENPTNWVVAIRPSLISDFTINGVVPTPADTWSFSMWHGYLSTAQGRPLNDWFVAAGSRIDHIHTSGHASSNDLRRFASSIGARILIPIHGENWLKDGADFPSIKPIKNGEAIQI